MMLTSLSNGLRVVFSHKNSDVASLYWWVGSGSVFEDTGEFGFAHFLEHMLFKDASAKDQGVASEGRMAREIEALGGDINAYTSFDQTVYHVTCAERHWESVIPIFSEMLKNQAFSEKDFKQEREVILEELRRSNDSPSRQLFQTAFEQTFAGTPLSRPVIGFESTLKKATPKALRGFLKRTYAVPRMGLVLVGPVGNDLKSPRIKKIMSLLERGFGRLPGSPVSRGKLREPMKWSRALPPKRTVQPIRVFDVQSPQLAMLWPAPGLKHPDFPVLDVVTSVLGQGDASRLTQKLFFEKALVTDIQASLFSTGDHGAIWCSLEAENYGKLLDGVGEFYDVLERLGRDGPTDEELERVIVHVESERTFASQTVDGLAHRLCALEFVLEDSGFDERYLRQLRDLRPADIARAVREKMLAVKPKWTLLAPKKQDSKGLKEKIDESLVRFGRGALSTSTVKKRSAAQPMVLGGVTVESGALASGLRWVRVERPDSQVFHCQLMVPGGLLLEQSDQAGFAHIMSETWTQGTESKDQATLAALIENRAADVSAFSGRNATGLEFGGLARDFGALSDLFIEVASQPRFPDAEVANAVRIAEEQIRSIEDHTSQVVSRLFYETLYETHPYGRSILGKLETLKSLQPSALRALHQKWIRPDRMAVSISGPIAAQDFQKFLARLDASFGPGKTDDVKPSHPIALQGPRWVKRKLGREQVHVMVGGLGCDFTSQDRLSLQLLATMLGGQGGRLFVELREKRSLAYSVSPVLVEGVDRGTVGTYIASAPAKVSEAIKGIQAVWEGLLSRPPSAREMERARQYYLGHRLMELQTDEALSNHYAQQTLFNLPFKSVDQIAAELRSISVGKLKTMVERYWLKPFHVEVQVG